MSQNNVQMHVLKALEQDFKESSHRYQLKSNNTLIKIYNNRSIIR